MRLGRDRAVIQVLQALVVGLVVFGAITVAVYLHQPEGADVAQRAYENRERQAHEIVQANEDWCCPEDPTAATVLENRAMEAWAGDPGPLERMFAPWFPDPRASDFSVKASWAPRHGGHAIHTVDLYSSGDSRGKTAGSGQPAVPPERGPVYVLPRLDRVSAESSADLLAVPVEDIWPYNVDPRGAHEDQVETTITYTRTTPGGDSTTTVKMDGYTEVTGAARPAIEMHFEEPDWQALEELALLDVKIDLEDVGRNFTQALTSEDLASEKALHENDVLENSEDLADGEYPHHRFELQVNLSGPGFFDDDGTHRTPHGETVNLTEAYDLSITVPRNWTDVEINRSDGTDNEDHNWTDTQVQALDEGGHRITSRLNVSTAYNVTGPDHELTHRRILNASDRIEAPFRFHARPPANATASELGFHDIQARLDPVRGSVHESADLTVEVATSPGRVHRSLDVHAPTHVPTTPWKTHEREVPEGVELVLGATLKNGGESANVDEVRWTLPQLNWSDPDGKIGGDRDLTVLEDYTGRDQRKWYLEQEGNTTHVVWNPHNVDALTDAETSCDRLEACAVAARLVLDGRPLEREPPWALPELLTLYEADDVDDYVKWFVRSEKAWEGVPLANDHRPGFALGHRYRSVDAGPAEGAHRFTVPPSLDPACDESTFDERNEADRRREGDRVYYDFGPREDGLAHLSTVCEREGRNFTAIAENGQGRLTQAIGRTDYRSVPGLSGQTVASWQNGLAESHVDGPDAVAAGNTANFSVEMDSFLSELVHDDVGNATVRAKLFDPYNAWENRPWLHWILRDNAGISEPGTDDAEGEDMTVPGDDEATSEPTSCSGSVVEEDTCEDPDSGEPIPRSFPLGVELPEDTVPGTHLLVIEVSWRFTTVGGTEITETGRLIEPFDVLSKSGERVQDVAMGVTAWDTDWR